MKPALKYLPLFLQADCNYTRGAVLAVRSAAQFRDAVLAELLLLERELGVSVHPLRATHLRSKLEELVTRFRDERA